MDTFLQDLRQTLRGLRRSPGFTAVALVTMALGIGANTAMFSVVNGVLLKPLPYADPGNLVRVWSRSLTNGQPGGDQSTTSPGDFLDWQAQSHAFSQLSAFTLGGQAAVTGVGVAEEVAISSVSPNLFALLGVRPAWGRDFLTFDADADASTVIISDGLWRRRFGADAQAIGRTLMLDGRPATVVGVMPRGFGFPASVEVWRPLRLTPSRGGAFLYVIGRLAPGQTLATAHADMDAVAVRLQRQYPASNTGWGVDVIPLNQQEVGRDRRALVVLSWIVALVLLIACVNVANLLSARASTRRREIALRGALGAGRARLVRQLFTESLVLGVLGGFAGLTAASFATPALLALNPESLSRAPSSLFDGRVLLFTAGVSVLAGLLFGLAPVLQLRHMDLETPLREGGRTGARSRSEGRARRWLVVSEVALALAVLTAAGLMMKSFLRVMRVDAGIETTNLLTFEIRLPGASYPVDRVRAFYPDLVDRLERLPGVASAAATFLLPLGGDNRVYGFGPEELPPGRYAANYRVVTPQYFHTMGMPLVAGRDFTDRDTKDLPAVVIVNQAMAQQFWTTASGAVGQRIVIRGQLPAATIVGVTGDVRHFGVESRPEPEMYVPHAQVPMSGMTLVVRTAGDPGGSVAAITDQVRAIDADLPVSRIRTMDELLATSTAPRRFTMTLFSVFGGIALLLAAVGVYGVTSHAVGERTREIGIRVALGATPRQVLSLIVGQHGRLVLIGLVLGALGALAAGRVSAGLLFEVQPNDPVVLLSGVLVLATIALAASIIPARRALDVDPIVALKTE